MRKLSVVLYVLVCVSGVGGKSRQDVPSAPLPSVVVNAKTIFLTNGGGSNLAYDSFYSEMKQWGRYEVVGSPQEADLIVELSYRVEQLGTRVWSSTNTYYGTTNVHSDRMEDPQLSLTIYDAKTKNSLWSEVDHRRLARLQKNREKETINSAIRLVQDLKTRISIAAALAAPTENKAAPTPLAIQEARPIVSSAPMVGNASESFATPKSKSITEGTVSITSDPEGASIFVDSVGHGAAPVIVKLPPGKHSFQLVMNGYKDWTSEVEVRAASIVNVSAALKK